MEKKIQQGLTWLNKQVEKDKQEIESHKKKLIAEIKTIDKTKLYDVKPKKMSLLKKLAKILFHVK